jgi:hypothetical protein
MQRTENSEVCYMIKAMHYSPYDRLPDSTVPNLRGFRRW